MLTRRLGMGLGQLAWGLAVGGLVAGGCKSEDDPPTVGGQGAVSAKGNKPPAAGRGGRAGGGGESGMAGDGNAATGNSDAGGEGPGVLGAPTVTVTSPKQLDDPNKAGVLVEPEVDVRCTVTQAPGDTREVAPETVFLSMLDADGNVVFSAGDITQGNVPGEPTGEEDEYGAKFLLRNVPDNGRVSFRCVGGDKSTPPLLASDTVETFVDHGPKITRIEPVADAAYRLEGALSVTFTVEPDPLTKKDEGAAIDTVEVSVAGVVLDDVDVVDGEYSAAVTLTDTSKFPPTLSGSLPITIKATNKRSPDAATAIDSYGFVVDGEGPQISISEPTNGAVVGGRAPLVFTVTDPLSGVDQQTVVVELNGMEYHFGEGGEWGVMGDVYTFKFDTTQIENSATQATINIRASDNAGNEAAGESWLLYLDNVPPIVDLDPPNIRMWKRSGTDRVCSTSFDPLGEATNDLGETKSKYGIFRALVWEMTNFVTGQPEIVHSGLVESSVRIYVQPDVSKPFIVNAPNDPDNDCDDIDQEAQSELEFIRLQAVTPAGGAPYASDPAAFPPISAFPAPGCIQTLESPPIKLCDEESDLSIVIKHTMEGRPPVIFGLAPLTGITCTGRGWELGAHAEEGWVCLAGRAVDYAGNVGISRPLRACYDDPDTSFVPDCTTGSTPPTCTDGCTLPPAYASRFLEE